LKEPGDAQFGYTVPNLQIEYAMRNTHVPVGPGAASTQPDGVYLECFMEEVRARPARTRSNSARADGQPPEAPRVLNAAAEKAGWGKPLLPACIAASRSSWATAATRRRSPRSR